MIHFFFLLPSYNRALDVYDKVWTDVLNVLSEATKTPSPHCHISPLSTTLNCDNHRGNKGVLQGKSVSFAPGTIKGDD